MEELGIEGHIDIAAARENNQHLQVNRLKRKIEGGSERNKRRKLGNL
jgi:hypothetical protein